MTISSHRLKIEEKKVYRKLLTSLGIFVAAILILIYAGIPILTKTIIFLTSFRKENVVSTPENILINPPILDPLAEATNSGTIAVSGMADKEVTVRISVNGEELAKVPTDKDGKFTSKNIRLKEGENIITATTLREDKESSPSQPLLISFKKNPPKLDISAPVDGQKFIAEAKEITINGETDPGNRVTVNDRFVIVAQDGKFNYKVTLSDGGNNFKIIATDIAGNQTIVERKVNYSP